MKKCNCPLCSSIIEYDETKFSVYCKSCGTSMLTQKLPEEKALNEQLKKQNEEIEQRYKDALRDKKAAEDRLDFILPNLEMITDAQFSTERIVKEILSKTNHQNDELEYLRDHQDELVTLIMQIRGEQKSTNEQIASLSYLVQAIMVGQGKQTREIGDLREMILTVIRTQGLFNDKLELLADISVGISKNQSLTRAEIATLRESTNEKLAKLQMSGDEQKAFNKSLESLIRTSHEKNSAAIEKISAATDHLQDSQQETNKRLIHLEEMMLDNNIAKREEEFFNKFMQRFSEMMPKWLDMGRPDPISTPSSAHIVDISAIRENLSRISNSSVYEKLARISNFDSVIASLDTRMQMLDVLTRSLPNSSDMDIVVLKEQIRAQRTVEGRKKIEAKKEMGRVIENCKQKLSAVQCQSVSKAEPQIASNIRDLLKSCAHDIDRTNLGNTTLGSDYNTLCKIWGV